MAKFRKRFKNSGKPKRWAKGHSSSSNTENRKYRDAARTGFFKQTLDLQTSSNLTVDTLKKHDAVQSVKCYKNDSSVSDESDAEENASMQSYESGTSFASEFSHCSNMSYNKFYKTFRPDCALHKEMLAILAAITDVVKESGGQGSTTEYHCALLTTLEQVMISDEERDEKVAAILALLYMGIKNVPQSVLRKGFNDVSKFMSNILIEFSYNLENHIIVKMVLNILTVFLKEQDTAVWTLSSTHQILSMMLNPFCFHSKISWRKAAQDGVYRIVKDNCFTKGNMTNIPADKVAEFCKEAIERCITQGDLSSNTQNEQAVLFRMLRLMKATIPFYSKNNIKACCEVLLRLFSLNYTMVNLCSFQVLYSLFSHQTAVVSSKVNAQLITALYEFQPSATNVQLTIAWLTVIQQAHSHLADVDLSLACVMLPKALSTITQLWLSDNKEITSAATHVIENLLRDVIVPACETPSYVEQNKAKLLACFSTIELGLGYQYSNVWPHVLHIIGVLFEVAGKNCSDLLTSYLDSLALLRDSYKFNYNHELEHAVGAAIRWMGPEVVLKVIPLQKVNQELNIDRSWLLPVLKENIRGSTLQFWKEAILPIAMSCQHQSTSLSVANDGIGAHSYELLYSQLWNLLPSFCNKPTDIKTNFKNVAKIMGTIIADHKDLRLAVMASLRKLIACAKESGDIDDVNEIARFDKNYLPILFNFYTIKPNGSDEEGQRLAALDTIKAYLTIAKPELSKQLFNNALERLSDEKNQSQELKESLLDLIRTLVAYQDDEGIVKLYHECIEKYSKMKKHKEQKKAYRLVEEICKSESDGCKQFLKSNRKQIEKLLHENLDSAAVTSKGPRMRCFIYLVKAHPNLSHQSKFLQTIIPEAVLCCKDVNEKCRRDAYSLLNVIGENLLEKNQLQNFIELLLAGFGGTTQMMSATILAFASILQNFSGGMGFENIEFVLKNVVKLIGSSEREIVGSSINFIKTYTKSLPVTTVGASLPTIVEALINMNEDCQKHFRLKVRSILQRLVRKFGSDSIIPYVPKNDAVLLKRLKNIRKSDSRKKKQKEAARNKSESDSDDEFALTTTKSNTIEDILANSDSEEECRQEEFNENKRKFQTWIHEDIDTITDFTDPTAVNRITSAKPTFVRAEINDNKNKDRGFKFAPDGRLIINDDDGSDSDTSNKKDFANLKIDDSDSEIDDKTTIETKNVTNNKSDKKRKRSECGSVKSTFSGKSGLSGKSGPAMKYQAGGSGIHRPISKAPSVGSEYKSRKGQGDIKKKGKMEPYAYVPLQRSSLNKRKRAKMSGQFKGIINKGVKKGKITKENRKKGKGSNRC